MRVCRIPLGAKWAAAAIPLEGASRLVPLVFARQLEARFWPAEPKTKLVRLFSSHIEGRPRFVRRFSGRVRHPFAPGFDIDQIGPARRERAEQSVRDLF